jgi:hypothetical protein
MAVNRVMNILNVTDVGEFIDKKSDCFLKHNFLACCLTNGWRSFLLADSNTSQRTLSVRVLFKHAYSF